MATTHPVLSPAVWLAAAALLLAPTLVQARIRGDLVRGQARAQTECRACHQVDASPAPSPFRQAPPFVTIANSPGVTALALRVALQSSHQTMPDFVLSPQDRDDIIAYILWLKGKPSPPSP